jgi:hypothetical protein
MTAHESSEQDSDNTQLSGLDELGELRSLLLVLNYMSDWKTPSCVQKM